MPSGSSSNVQSRRSHTKSRKGCKTCKKRHIRCDETFRQCRNCTKHNVICDYQDDPRDPHELPSWPGVPDLSITEIDRQQLKIWMETGVLPFENLGIEYRLSPERYTEEDRRLIHHIVSIASQMQAAEEGKHTIWTRRVPMFLKIAASNDFVMHSLLGLSASHLSWLTTSPATMQLAYKHRGLAFKGLQQAIGNFSKENSDAVLAASILLSWQVTDWSSWASLLRGTSTVVDAMQGWKYESAFADFIEERELFAVGQTRPPIIPNPERDMQVMNHVYTCLLRLLPYFEGKEEESRVLDELIMFIDNLRMYLPLAQTVDEQFELLHPLRAFLFFLPLDFLRRVNRDLSVMVLLAYFYGVALAVEPLFPAIGAAYFGTMSIGPVEAIHTSLVRGATLYHPEELRTAFSFMDFPMEMASEFRKRMNWLPTGGISAAVSPVVSTREFSLPNMQPTLNMATALGGFDFSVFPEYMMVQSPTRGSPRTLPAGSHSVAENVHGSLAAAGVIASTMWK